jgi:hypothetical protein
LRQGAAPRGRAPLDGRAGTRQGASHGAHRRRCWAVEGLLVTPEPTRAPAPAPVRDHSTVQPAHAPAHAPPAATLVARSLQRTVGNAAAAQLLRAAAGPILQRNGDGSVRESVKAGSGSRKAVDARAAQAVERRAAADQRAHDARAAALQAQRGIAVQPDVIVALHQTLPTEIESYDQWLAPDAEWAGRPKAVRDNRAATLLVVAEQKAKLAECQAAFPATTAFASRSDTREFNANHEAGIRGVIAEIRSRLASIDDTVKEPPPPPKHWAAFMGDPARPDDYHEGTATDPIPVVWYKDTANYEPITIRGVRYAFPHGPTVTGRLGTHTLEVDAANQFGVGSMMKNTKKKDSRARQVDINYALTTAGYSMAGKDGDHVRDLGFNGSDVASNYWPLRANVNRRPFLGWRGSYGINYTKFDGTLATAPITGLEGKTFTIKAFMAAGDANVPHEGVKPETNAGTDVV